MWNNFLVQHNIIYVQIIILLNPTEPIGFKMNNSLQGKRISLVSWLTDDEWQVSERDQLGSFYADRYRKSNYLLFGLLYKLFENWDMTDNSGLIFVISKFLVILVYFSLSLSLSNLYINVFQVYTFLFKYLFDLFVILNL